MTFHGWYIFVLKRAPSQDNIYLIVTGGYGSTVLNMLLVPFRHGVDVVRRQVS